MPRGACRLAPSAERLGVAVQVSRAPSAWVRVRGVRRTPRCRERVRRAPHRHAAAAASVRVRRGESFFFETERRELGTRGSEKGDSETESERLRRWATGPSRGTGEGRRPGWLVARLRLGSSGVFGSSLIYFYFFLIKIITFSFVLNK